MYSRGPWQNTNGTVESADGWHIASVHGHVGPDAKKSNGNIIAAAPDMLKILTVAVEQYTGLPDEVLIEVAPDWLSDALVVIAKCND